MDELLAAVARDDNGALSLDLLEKTRGASSAGGAGVATARNAPTAVSGVNVAAASGIAANDSAPSRHWIGGVSTETGPHAVAGAPESPAPSTDNNPGVDFLTPELWQGLTAWLSDSPLEMLRRHSTDPRPTGTMHQNILNDVRAHASAHSYRSTRANCFMTPSGFGCFPTLRERVRHSGGIPFSAAGRLRSNKWTPRCPRCDFKPSTKRALERHLNTEHREDRTFHQSISKPRRARGRAGCVPIRVCPYCAWVCITKAEMVSHVRAHGSLTEDPKPYVDPFFVSSQRPRRAPSQRSAPKRTRTPARPRALAVPGGAAKLVNRGKRALPKLAETALRGGKVYMVDGPNARPFFRGLGPSVLPYRPHSLHWDAAGTSNREGVYCYCGHGRHSGHDRWPMIQCSACSQFFHGGCIVTVEPGSVPWGDTEYDFWCSVCGGGFEVYQPYSKTWLAVCKIAMCKLMLSNYEQSRFLFPTSGVEDAVEAVWQAVCNERSLPQDWRTQVKNTLNANANLFQSTPSSPTLWTLTAAGAAETKDAPPARLRRAAIRGEQSIRALEKQQAKGAASGRDNHATLPGVPGERLLALASAVQASDASMPNGEGSAASMQPRPPSAPSNVLGKLTVLEAASGQRIDLHVESDSDSSNGDDVADRSRGVSSEKRGRHDIDNDDWSTSEDDIMSFSSEGDMFDSDGSDGDSSQGSHVHRHAHGSHLIPDWLFMHLQAKRQQSVSQGGTQPVKKRARKGTNGDTHGAGSKAAAVLVCSGCSKQYKTQKGYDRHQARCPAGGLAGSGASAASSATPTAHSASSPSSGGRGRHECSNCGQTFVTVAALATHQEQELAAMLDSSASGAVANETAANAPGAELVGQRIEVMLPAAQPTADSGDKPRFEWKPVVVKRYNPRRRQFQVDRGDSTTVRVALTEHNWRPAPDASTAVDSADGQTGKNKSLDPGTSSESQPKPVAVLSRRGRGAKSQILVKWSGQGSKCTWEAEASVPPAVVAAYMASK